MGDVIMAGEKRSKAKVNVKVKKDKESEEKNPLDEVLEILKGYQKGFSRPTSELDSGE